MGSGFSDTIHLNNNEGYTGVQIYFQSKHDRTVIQVQYSCLALVSSHTKLRSIFSNAAYKIKRPRLGVKERFFSKVFTQGMRPHNWRCLQA